MIRFARSTLWFHSLFKYILHFHTEFDQIWWWYSLGIITCWPLVVKCSADVVTFQKPSLFRRLMGVMRNSTRSSQSLDSEPSDGENDVDGVFGFVRFTLLVSSKSSDWKSKTDLFRGHWIWLLYSKATLQENLLWHSFACPLDFFLFRYVHQQHYCTRCYNRDDKKPGVQRSFSFLRRGSKKKDSLGGDSQGSTVSALNCADVCTYKKKNQHFQEKKTWN